MVKTYGRTNWFRTVPIYCQPYNKKVWITASYAHHYKIHCLRYEIEPTCSPQNWTSVFINRTSVSNWKFIDRSSLFPLTLLRIYSGRETNSTSVLYSGREINRTSVFATDLNQRVQQSIEPACSSIKLKLQSASVPLQNSSSNSNIEENCWN